MKPKLDLQAWRRALGLLAFLVQLLMALKHIYKVLTKQIWEETTYTLKSRDADT